VSAPVGNAQTSGTLIFFLRQTQQPFISFGHLCLLSLAAQPTEFLFLVVCDQVFFCAELQEVFVPPLPLVLFYFIKGLLKRFVLLHIPTNMTALSLKTSVKKIIKIYPQQGAVSKMYFFSGAT
jgi:hypothetical protein